MTVRFDTFGGWGQYVVLDPVLDSDNDGDNDGCGYLDRLDALEKWGMGGLGTRTGWDRGGAKGACPSSPELASGSARSARSARSAYYAGSHGSNRIHYTGCRIDDEEWGYDDDECGDIEDHYSFTPRRIPFDSRSMSLGSAMDVVLTDAMAKITYYGLSVYSWIVDKRQK